MDSLKPHSRKRVFTPGMTGIAAILLCAQALVGCSSSRVDPRKAYAVFVQPPVAPAVIATPAGLFLTNYPAFSARLHSEGAHPGKGYLYGSNGKLAYVPDPEKRGPSGQFSFIWDVASNSGYVLSEALQGYAPLTLTGMGVVTNAQIQAGASAKSRTLSVALDNGRTVQYTALSESAPSRFPTEISGGSPRFETRLSQISLSAPRKSLFTVPEGFTRYESPEAMVDEMAVRYRNLKRRIY